MNIFWYYKKGYTAKQYTKFYCWLMNLIDFRLWDDDGDCRYQAPYGFVANAGCVTND